MVTERITRVAANSNTSDSAHWSRTGRSVYASLAPAEPALRKASLEGRPTGTGGRTWPWNWRKRLFQGLRALGSTVNFSFLNFVLPLSANHSARRVELLTPVGSWSAAMVSSSKCFARRLVGCSRRFANTTPWSDPMSSTLFSDSAEIADSVSPSNSSYVAVFQINITRVKRQTHQLGARLQDGCHH
ncbi:hypothetical protein ON010_g19093 [Phytophthora cinnamomi]|nr:hypothetical protein ON010_g19093 [Phytophthora cinnamomi]